jgi:alkylhydroperoxidase family enzyme
VREKRVRKDEERQQAAAERLERHSADLAEREQALARLGQSLLSRRNGDAIPVDEPATATFAEGFDALSAASRTKG